MQQHDPRGVGALAFHAPFRHPFRLTRQHLATITAPVLIVHGSDDIAHPVEEAAKETYDALTGSTDRRMFIVQGGPHCCDLTHEPIVSEQVIAFLASHPAIESAPVRVDRVKALKLVSEITGDPSVLERDASLAISYHSLSPATLATQQALFAEGLARAKLYAGPIEVEGISQPWEEQRESEWRFSRRNDYDGTSLISAAEDDKLRAANQHRRASASSVVVHTDVETVEDQS